MARADRAEAEHMTFKDHVDPAFEYAEIHVADRLQPVGYVATGCRHPRVVPVEESLTGDIVARLCLDCDTQMPPVPLCLNEQDGKVCTKERGHSGEHVAHEIELGNREWGAYVDPYVPGKPWNGGVV